MVVHGGIDGFSRLPVYLKASTNNTSGTVLNHFLGAVGFLWPSITWEV